MKTMNLSNYNATDISSFKVFTTFSESTTNSFNPQNSRHLISAEVKHASISISRIQYMHQSLLVGCSTRETVTFKQDIAFYW